MDTDTRIFHAINDFARDTPWLQPIVAGYANYGTVLFALLMLAGWWMARSAVESGRMAAALWAPFGVLAALAINQPIADAVGEVRPCNALHDIVVLHCNTDPGFPSDHAVMAGAATIGLWLVHRRLGLVATLASAAMGFARIYVGAHYPQDVLAGYALGAVVSVAGYLLIRPALTRLIVVIARSPLHSLVVHAQGNRDPLELPGTRRRPSSRV
ncbi:MAG: phosphatase PAP2 family protein [Mycobacterium sp.]|jgi:undecaprenyl-diphosphatase|nr:phosphatase PAP2 family protein [Mycobacterium sp.]